MEVKNCISSFLNVYRWGIVTHGGIDGYSRFIAYLTCGLNNKGSTVLHHFVQACVKFGIPAKVRSDHARENILVGLFMNLVNGEGQSNAGCIITGPSVHNQRIERRWKDVYNQVISVFYNLFYEMEDEGLLDINEDVHIFCLQFLFIPLINAHLRTFQNAWNKHSVRTDGYGSPERIWLDGVLSNLNSSTMAIPNLFNGESVELSLANCLQHYGLTLDSFQPNLQDESTSTLHFSDEQLRNLSNTAAETDDLKKSL